MTSPSPYGPAGSTLLLRSCEPLSSNFSCAALLLLDASLCPALEFYEFVTLLFFFCCVETPSMSSMRLFGYGWENVPISHVLGPSAALHDHLFDCSIIFQRPLGFFRHWSLPDLALYFQPITAADLFSAIQTHKEHFRPLLPTPSITPPFLYPICRDNLNNRCERTKCRYVHLRDGGVEHERSRRRRLRSRPRRKRPPPTPALSSSSSDAKTSLSSPTGDRQQRHKAQC